MPLNKTFYMIKYDFKEPEQNWSIEIKENLTVLQEITHYAGRLIVISFSMATRLGNAWKLNNTHFPGINKNTIIL